MNTRNVLILVLVLAGGPHLLCAQDSGAPGGTFSESERAAFFWISNSNAGNGLSMLTVGISIPLALLISPGTFFWVGLIAAGFQVAAVTSTAIAYSVLDSALVKEGKDALRPGAPISWSYVSAGSFVAAFLSYLLAGYLGPSGFLPELLSAVFVLTGEISAAVTFFATSGYIEMMRENELERGPEKVGRSPDVLWQAAPSAVGPSDKIGLLVQIPLLSIRY